MHRNDSTSTTLDTTATTATTPATSPTTAGRWRRVGGAAGIFFAVGVLLQNALRAVSGAPSPGSSPAEVSAYVVGAAGTTAVLTGLFALNVVALALFAGAVAREAWRAVPVLVVAGLLGIGGVLSLFSLTALVNLATVARAAELDGSVLVGLWSLHDAAFALNMAPLGLALAALGTAGTTVGITPRPFRVLAPLGAVLLVSAAAGGLWIVDGGPLLALGLVGFLTWVAFLLSTGWRLAHRSDRAD